MQKSVIASCEYACARICVINNFVCNIDLIVFPFADKKFFDPRVAIHRARWNPNVHARGWLATATALGVVRLQNVMLEAAL